MPRLHCPGALFFAMARFRNVDYCSAMTRGASAARACVSSDTPRNATGMKSYADMPVLGELNARRFLVTSGFQRLQSSKVHALGIERQFERVAIDAIDEPDRVGQAGDL